MPWIFHSFINFSKPSKFHPSWPPYFQPVTTFLILNCEHWREDPRHMMWAFSFNLSWKWKLLSCVQLLVTPWTICSWNFPGQNTGVGSLSLLQGIFSIQELNQGLLHCRWIHYQLSYQGSPFTFFGDMFIQILCSFFLARLSSYTSVCKSSVYILDISPCDICFTNTFSQSLSLFIFLMYFEEQNF